jgi:DNA polymerase III epsilon subunit-like protein
MCNEFLNLDGLNPENRVIIGHNVQFDRKFLHALWESQEQEFPATLWLDTMKLISAYMKKMGIKGKRNLHAACDLLQIKKFADAHNAKVDTRNTYLLYNALINDKNMDYLPFIENIPHSIDPKLSAGGLDPSLL